MNASERNANPPSSSSDSLKTVRMYWQSRLSASDLTRPARASMIRRMPAGERQPLGAGRARRPAGQARLEAQLLLVPFREPVVGALDLVGADGGGAPLVEEVGHFELRADPLEEEEVVDVWEVFRQRFRF